MPNDLIINKKTKKSKARKEPKGRLLSKELRKCPSCKQLMIETRVYGSKITVQSKYAAVWMQFAHSD